MIRRTRIEAHIADAGNPTNLLANNTEVIIFNRAAHHIDVGIYGGPKKAKVVATQAQLDEFESFTLTLKAMANTNNEGPTPETEASATLTITDRTLITDTQWSEDTAQTLRFQLTGAQLALAAGPFWITIHGLRTDGEKTPLVVGRITLKESSLSEPGDPAPGVTWISLAEGDARYLRVGMAGDGKAVVVTMDATLTGQQLLFAVPLGWRAIRGDIFAVTKSVGVTNDPPALQVSLGTELAPEAYIPAFVVESNTVDEIHTESLPADTAIPAGTEVFITQHVASNSTLHIVEYIGSFILIPEA